MGFRNPITTAADPTARQSAAAAQQAATAAATAAQTAQTAANTAITNAGAAQQTASTALTTASGKTTVYVGSAAPTAPAGGFTVGDQWVDTGHGNLLNGWNGSSWAALPAGSGALAANAVTAAVIAAGAIDGKVITGATVRTGASGQRVQIDSANGLIGYNAAGQAVTQIRTSDGTLIASGAQITGTLDTGTASGIGVKVYGDNGVIGSGTVEWDTNGATVKGTLTRAASGSGGTGFSLALDSGPALGLNYVPLNDGSGGATKTAAFTGINRLELPGAATLPGGADPYNDGTTGAIAGTAAPAGTRLHRRIWTGLLTGNTQGDATVTFPGGGFPNGLVAVEVTPLPSGSGAAGPYTWLPWGATKTAVNVRCYTFGSAVPVNGPTLAASVVAWGW